MKHSPAIHLLSVALNRSLPLPDGFPFTVPVVQSLEELAFTTPVTFFVGENGCGKSTLLEAIACAVGTLSAVRELAKWLKLTWSVRTRKGFFLRAEDFFGYARRMAMLREEMQRELERVDREYENKSRTAQMYARAAYQGQIAAIEGRYGEGLDARSHGEAFLDFFQSRFVPGGLYLLDEPEAPLSPLRQMSFLVLIKDMIEQDAQFIIATHSPIIMAFPGATILSMDEGVVEAVEYEMLEHVRITKGFLNHPERYLARLFEREG
jgi:predicted ATPase